MTKTTTTSKTENVGVRVYFSNTEIVRAKSFANVTKTGIFDAFRKVFGVEPFLDYQWGYFFLYDVSWELADRAVNNRSVRRRIADEARSKLQDRGDSV